MCAKYSHGRIVSFFPFQIFCLSLSLSLSVLSGLMVNCKRIGQSFICRQTAMVLINRSRNLPGRNKFRILEKVWHRQSTLELHASLPPKRIFWVSKFHGEQSAFTVTQRNLMQVMRQLLLLEHKVRDPLKALLFVVSAVAYCEKQDNNQQQTDAGCQDFIL